MVKKLGNTGICYVPSILLKFLRLTDFVPALPCFVWIKAKMTATGSKDTFQGEFEEYFILFYDTQMSWVTTPSPSSVSSHLKYHLSINRLKETLIDT